MGITGGPDTALWFAEQSAGNIGRTTTSGAVSEYATPSGSPYQITTGADGALWFTEPATNNIGRITPAGAVSEFAVPSGNSPQGIVAGPDGNL
ncbi:MAG: hypothetical protein GIW99_05465 [Candidatus Eremiobacteraeota bacterium]|nr:hypothetical protein [Candidatus Eremiobacteraeota bacterium]